MDEYSARLKKRQELIKAKKAETKERMDNLMRRVHGLLQPMAQDGMSVATDMPAVPFRLFLMDMSLEGISLFSRDSLGEGQRVEIRANMPNWYAVQATVLWCNQVNLTSGVVQPDTFGYRMGCQWKFSSESEQEQFKRIFQSYQNGR
jgi:hypothetical protein